MTVLYEISVWIHILAASVWIGGMAFLTLVVVPILRRPALREHAPMVMQLAGRRFRWVGWSALALLAVTGTFNIVSRGYHWGDLWRGDVGRTLGVKLVLFATVVALSMAHDVFSRRPQMRKLSSCVARLTLALSLGIVALAVMFVRGRPW